VLPDDGVLHRNMYELFNINFNANLKLFLRLSNCASVGEKTLILIKMHGMYVKNIDIYISYPVKPVMTLYGRK